MLKLRVLTALCGLPILFAAVWFDKPLPWLTVFLALWTLAATYEFYTLVGVARILSLTVFGMVWSLFFLLSPHFHYEFLVPLLLTSAIAFSLILLLFRREKEGAFLNWVRTMAGMLYVGWFLSYLVALRLEAGRNWIFFIFLTTFASDMLAYFVGSTIGRHPLAPHISPKKTWEGAIAGVIGPVIVSLLFTLKTPLGVPLDYLQAILLGVGVGVFGQLGGLVLSLLKRNAGVKDSGKLLPGHGGLLDRTDSVVFAALVVYYYWLFIVK